MSTSNRRLVLTVDRPPSELAHRVEPLLADALRAAATGTPTDPSTGIEAVDVEVSPAPGGRGSEIAVRWRAADPGRERRDTLRAALRHTKQQLETGAVLQLEPQPHGRRRATPAGLVFDAVRRRLDRKGML